MTVYKNIVLAVIKCFHNSIFFVYRYAVTACITVLCPVKCQFIVCADIELFTVNDNILSLYIFLDIVLVTVKSEIRLSVCNRLILNR